MHSQGVLQGPKEFVGPAGYFSSTTASEKESKSEKSEETSHHNMGSLFSKRNEEDAVQEEESWSRCVVEESSECSSDARGKETDKRATAIGLMDKLERQGYRCALSGMKLTPETTVLDHITARSDGGTDDIDNLQWLHTDINRMKGTMQQERFLQLCALVNTSGS